MSEQGQVTQINKPKPPMIIVRDNLVKRIDELRTALPPHMPADRFIRVVMTAMQLNPDLTACSWSSLWNSCMKAANDGLWPDGDEAAIVPFKTKATYMPMYQGLLKRFRNSGQFSWLATNAVYEGETFEHWIDEQGEHLRHIPGDDNEGKKIRRIYAIARTKDGASFIADLPISEIERAKSYSKARRDDSPWKEHFEAMGKKTAIKRLAKLLPKSTDIEAVLRRDDEDDDEPSPAIELAEARRESGRSAALEIFAQGAADEPIDTDQQNGTTETTTVDQETGEISERTETAHDAAHTSLSDRTNPSPTVLEIAFQSGIAARQAGMQRKAIPGVYRDEARKDELDAWLKGWDSLNVEQGLQR
jgi:recombination protein RecT